MSNNTDRNTMWGFLLMGILVVGYFYYSQRAQQSYLKSKQATADSLAKVQQRRADSIRALHPEALPDSAALAADSASGDSSAVAGGLFASAPGEPGTITVENDLLKVTFTSLGGHPEKVELKHFKSHTGDPLMLVDAKYNDINLQFLSTDHRLVNTAGLNFRLVRNEQLPDSSQVVQYRLYGANPQQFLEYTYTLHPGQYMVDFNLRANGLEGLISPADSGITLVWHGQANQLEQDSVIEKRYTQIYYGFDNKELDYFTLERSPDKAVDQPVQWLSFKQQFFNRTLVAKQHFSRVSYKSLVPKDTAAGYVARTEVRFSIPYSPSPAFSFPMQIYYGPNDYYVLKSYHMGLEEVIPLGYGIYAFAKYLNKWIFLPLFVLLGKIFGSWGVVIIFMTIAIRLLISPLTYKSYLSQAKMKVLKPELDELKAKYKGDQQKFGMEQMKLYRTVGVSPLGGCMPALLQLPIFASLYCLFQSSIEVRHQSFLWANDLSMYDSIAQLPFKIPFYGDHVSLFTLLMTLTSLVLALYNQNMTSAAAGQDNPMIKYMPYLMPVFFLGFFNSLPAALTLYYFISNLITIVIQWVIQKYIIDDAKLHAQMQEKKKSPVPKSKFMQRLEQVQKQQQAAVSAKSTGNQRGKR